MGRGQRSNSAAFKASDLNPMKVELTASAEEDLLDGFRFYERQQQHLGEYFLDSLFADIDALAISG